MLHKTFQIVPSTLSPDKIYLRKLFKVALFVVSLKLELEQIK